MQTRAKHITPVAIIVLRNEHGEFLMTDRVESDPEDAGIVVGHDFWQLPGGGIEVGETVEEAAVREAQEELGITVVPVSTIPKVYSTLRTHWHGLLIAVVCRKSDPTTEINLNHESSKYQWVTLEQARSLNSFPETYDILQRAALLMSVD